MYFETVLPPNGNTAYQDTSFTEHYPDLHSLIIPASYAKYHSFQQTYNTYYFQRTPCQRIPVHSVLRFLLTPSPTYSDISGLILLCVAKVTTGNPGVTASLSNKLKSRLWPLLLSTFRLYSCGFGLSYS